MDKKQKLLYYWLILGCILVLCMVIIGGITRLTGSGLSMVQWNLLMGAIPPLNEAQWQASFEQYQQFPEYKIVNAGMTLSEYKFIFFWEYLHRMWGRMLGLVFMIPFAAFLYFKVIPKKHIRDLVFILLLGAFQGFMGWFMVKSGLVDKPSVSQYRLTAHLVLALTLMAYVYIIAFKVRFSEPPKEKNEVKVTQWSLLLLVAVGIQIIIGGFMAGLKAALFYPSYPKMGETMVPDNLFHYDPFLSNFFDNPSTVNFMHRHFPWVILILAAIFVYKTFKSPYWKSALRIETRLMKLLLLLQITLGIITLVSSVGKIPVFWGVSHQVIGIVLFMVCLHIYLKTRKLQAH